MLLGKGTHYEPIGWDEAFALIAAQLNKLDSPNEAVFTSRTSNNLPLPAFRPSIRYE